MIESFMPPMHEHLVEEMPMLMTLKKHEDKVDWDKYWRKKSVEIMEKGKSEPNAMVCCSEAAPVFH